MVHYNNDIISYLKANDILAIKLDHAFTGIRYAVSDQIDTIADGAQRLAYYTSCFTDEYQDVCRKQKTEDIRFTEGVSNLIQHRNVINTMLRIYFEDVFKNKTAEQLGNIKKILMAANVHISASSLTKEGFSLVVAAAVSWGKVLSADMSVLAGRTAGVAVSVVGLYGVVQKAADSANRLHGAFPSYYEALYSQRLEMMYFLIEPLFDRFGALNAQRVSDSDIANMIINMTGYHD